MQITTGRISGSYHHLGEQKVMNVVQETPAPEIPLTVPRTGLPVFFEYCWDIKTRWFCEKVTFWDGEWVHVTLLNGWKGDQPNVWGWKKAMNWITQKGSCVKIWQTSWCFQAIWKICSNQIRSFPQQSGWKKKIETTTVSVKKLWVLRRFFWIIQVKNQGIRCPTW